MEDNYQNRQASARKRGRPSLAEVAARPPAEPATLTQLPNPVPTLPPITGFQCKACGRGQNPRCLKTEGDTRTMSCGLCGARHKVSYRGQLPETIQLI